MNFEDKLIACNFSFCIAGDLEIDGENQNHDSIESLFTLYFISAPSANHCNDFGNIRNEFLSAQKKSEDLVQLSQSILLRFSKRFDNFDSIESFRKLNDVIDSIQKFWLQQKAPDAVDPSHPCVNESSELFRIVFKFQGIVSLRFGFVEGAHRHLSYYCLLLNLQLETIGEDEVSSDPYLIRQPINDGNVKFSDELFLKYFVYVGRLKEDPKRIVEAAIALSKKSADTHKWSVYNEDVHE